MPADIFAITAKEMSTRLNPDTRRGSLVFSVANTLDREVNARASARAEGDAKASFKVQPESVLLKPREAKVFTVDIAVPKETAPGSYGVKLIVVDDEKPDELFTTGPVAKFEVPAPVVPNGPPPTWLWIVLAAALVLIIGVAAYFIFRPKPPPPPPPAQQLHESCLVAAAATVDPTHFCGTGLKCVQLRGDSMECRREPEVACKEDSECSSYWCRDKKCSKDDGSCKDQQDCRGPFTCTANKVCRQNNGQACTQSELCASGFCAAGTCQDPPSPCQPPCGPKQFCMTLLGRPPMCTFVGRPPIIFNAEIMRNAEILMRLPAPAETRDPGEREPVR
jgi:hypothetical protein